MLKGFAFVNFPSPADALYCVAQIAGTQLEGSTSGRTLTACLAEKQGIDANLTTLAGCTKKNRRKHTELPWVRVDGVMRPIQSTERALVLS